MSAQGNIPLLPFLTAIQELTKQVERVADALEAGAQAAGPQAPAVSGATKQIPVDAIKLATRSEKPETDRWVVIGGNFKQYGITVWPEVLEAAGIKPEKLKDRGENKPGVPLVAIYTEKANDEGKQVPDKVIEIRKAG